jgi:hypothetical protein
MADATSEKEFSEMLPWPKLKREMYFKFSGLMRLGLNEALDRYSKRLVEML